MRQIVWNVILAIFRPYFTGFHKHVLLVLTRFAHSCSSYPEAFFTQEKKRQWHLINFRFSPEKRHDTRFTTHYSLSLSLSLSRRDREKPPHKKIFDSSNHRSGRGKNRSTEPRIVLRNADAEARFPWFLHESLSLSLPFALLFCLFFPHVFTCHITSKLFTFLLCR